MERIEVNVITGKQTIIPLTAEEILEIQSRPQTEPQAPALQPKNLQQPA